MSRRSCRRRVGTIHSKVPTIEVCGLQEKHLMLWKESAESDSDLDFSETSDDYARDESADIIYPAVEEVLPYPRSLNRLVKFRHFNIVKPEHLPEIDTSAFYRGSLLADAANPLERQIANNIIDTYNDLEAKSGAVDTWLSFRASLLYRCMCVFWRNSKKDHDYKEEAYMNSVQLFDRIMMNCVRLTRLKQVVPYHITNLPMYMDTGVSREEITSIMCGCMHLSTKLANARHISSRSLATEFDTIENTVHLYEIIILKELSCNVQVMTSVNICHHWLSGSSLEPYVETIRYMADLLLIMASYNHLVYDHRNDILACAAISAAECLFDTYSTEVEIDLTNYKLRKLSPTCDAIIDAIADELLTCLHDNSQQDRVPSSLVDKADHVAAAILAVSVKAMATRMDLMS